MSENTITILVFIPLVIAVFGLGYTCGQNNILRMWAREADKYAAELEERIARLVELVKETE